MKTISLRTMPKTMETTISSSKLFRIFNSKDRRSNPAVFLYNSEIVRAALYFSCLA